jgi:hypothetical protein
MRPFSRRSRWLTAVVLGGALAGCAIAPATIDRSRPRSGSASVGAAATAATPATSTSSTPTTTTTVAAPVPAPAPAPVFATGNAQLDALLPTLPAVLFEGGATVHYGYNPLDTCCHAGGYNPTPNDVWIGQSAFATPARLRYVVVHELAHSLHLQTDRGSALTTAVSNAPVVRAGPWDASEKVADCVAWVLAPVETAASGITYWACPELWRSQVGAALQ